MHFTTWIGIAAGAAALAATAPALADRVADAYGAVRDLLDHCDALGISWPRRSGAAQG